MIDAAKNQKRDIAIDVSNILACISVIALHHNGLVHSYDKTRAWKEALAVECICYWCVPVFLMITGATLLNYRAKYDTKTFFKKRFQRAFIPWLAWSMIFLTWKLKTKQIELSSSNSIIEILNLILNNKIMTVYWFYSSLFAIYLAIPALSQLVKYRETLWYIVLINFFFQSCLPVIRTWTKISWNLDVPIVGGSIIFVILGYLLKDKKFSGKQRIIVYVLGFGCMIFRYIYTYHFSILKGSTDTTIMGYNMFHSVLYTIAVWIMLRQIDWEKLLPFFIKKNLAMISSCSLGIYLIHHFIMHYEMVFFRINNHSLFWRTGFIFITYIISLIIVSILKNIPLICRIVP